MAVYLVDHPPARSQYRSPRRAKPSGVCVVHTAESFPDETGPDTGAENVARFIRDRSTPGSYHDLADSDSIVQLVRYSDEAFHDGTGSNPHSYGVSAATQAAKWPQLDDDWVEATVRNMARAAARYATWVKTNHGIVIPARRITRAQSEDRVPGFLSHAERDPARRTDPGKSFPWGQFLADYAAFMAGQNPDTPEDFMTDAQYAAVIKKLDYLESQNKAIAGHVLHDVPVRVWENGPTLPNPVVPDKRETPLGALHIAMRYPVLVYLAANSDALADKIAERLGGSADAAQVRQAVRDVLGSLDEVVEDGQPSQ